MMNWGVPDWMDALAYPEPDAPTTREWWWEFTRRRPDYRQEWGAAPAVAGQDYRYADNVHEFRLRYQLSAIHDPRRSASDWELMHWRYPVNYSRAPTAAVNAEQAEIEASSGVYHFAFDLRQPLKEQLDLADRLLRSIQRDLHPAVTDRRQLREQWPIFLRVLDARGAHPRATFQQITDVMHPNSEEGHGPGWARDKYVSACNLRDNFAF